MRRYRVFAAGVSVALLLGAATPALAKPGKAVGHQKEPAKTRPAKGPKAKPKPPKKTHAPKSKLGVSGGGATTGGGEFSIQARNDRQGRLAKGHFNYTDATLKVRCRNFATNSTVEITPVATPPAVPSAHIVKTDCVATGADQVSKTVTVDAWFYDGGQPSSTGAAGPDRIVFKVTHTPPAPATPVELANVDSLVTGNIKVRP